MPLFGAFSFVAIVLPKLPRFRGGGGFYGGSRMPVPYREKTAGLSKRWELYAVKAQNSP